MSFRTAGACAAFLIGVTGTAGPALAQFFPPQPPPRYVPAPLPPLLPPVDIEEEALPPPYDVPPGYRQGGRGYNPNYDSLPPPPVGRAYPVEPEPYPPPPAGTYRAQPPQIGRVYPVEPEPYPLPPPGAYRPDPPGYEQPTDPATRPSYGAAPSLPNPLDILRPPGSIGPGPGQPGVEDRATNDRTTTGSVYAALPPEDRPELGPKKELPLHLRRAQVDYRTREPAGTIIIDTPNTYLYLVLGNGKAMRYGIGVGREGFTWAGAERISKMAEWPDWHPPAEMIERQPYLPRFMAGGDGNPLGARALYLGKTLYRIHGTNQPSTIGTFVSSGCIRLTNDDVTDLYARVQVGTRVVVLPGRAPATASAVPVGPSAGPAAEPPAGPYNPLAPPRR